MRFRSIVSFFLITVILLSVCACAQRESDTVELLSEGADTQITINGYTDFRSSFRFLEKGDKVAVISPSSLPSREQCEATVEGLREWGYIPVEGQYVCAEERSLEQCLEDLEWALKDPEIKAVFCVRGGYASSEVMDRLPLSLIRQANKPIIGYSDITVYHSAWTRVNVPSIHSMMSASFIDQPEDWVEAEKKILQGEVASYRCEGNAFDLKGTAQGILIGGNLSTFTAVMGTEYNSAETDEPYILFLEDVGEDYAHIHRYMTVLEHLGVLDKAAGIIFGEWTEYPAECRSYSGDSRGGKFQSVAEMISRQFMKDKSIPVAFSFPAGHGEANYPMLMGATVRLDVSENGYTIEWVTP